MKKYWAKIEAWFDENEPAILSTFNDGATEDEFTALKQLVGFELPKDFVAFYTIHNGQNAGGVYNSAIIEPDSEGLSSIGKIMETYKLYQGMNAHATAVSEKDVEAGIKPLYWTESWLPIMEDGMGNSYFIDLDPADGGNMEQIIFRDYQGPTYELIAKSFKTWIKEYVEGNLD
jgi:cell wall assembly regulator SMI1